MRCFNPLHRPKPVETVLGHLEQHLFPVSIHSTGRNRWRRVFRLSVVHVRHVSIHSTGRNRWRRRSSVRGCAEGEVSIHSTGRNRWRFYCCPQCSNRTRFQSTPPAETGGDARSSAPIALTHRFNPLHRPKPVETRKLPAFPTRTTGFNPLHRPKPVETVQS